MRCNLGRKREQTCIFLMRDTFSPAEASSVTFPVLRTRQVLLGIVAVHEVRSQCC